MQINKWHVRRAGEARRAGRYRSTPDVESHWISVDNAVFNRLEAVAHTRRCSVAYLVDKAINDILNREGVP